MKEVWRDRYDEWQDGRPCPSCGKADGVTWRDPEAKLISAVTVEAQAEPLRTWEIRTPYDCVRCGEQIGIKSIKTA